MILFLLSWNRSSFSVHPNICLIIPKKKTKKQKKQTKSRNSWSHSLSIYLYIYIYIYWERETCRAWQDQASWILDHAYLVTRTLMEEMLTSVNLAFFRLLTLFFSYLSICLRRSLIYKATIQLTHNLLTFHFKIKSRLRYSIGSRAFRKFISYIH